MVTEAIERFGKIDILVNNVGIAGPNAAVVEMKEEEWLPRSLQGLRKAPVVPTRPG